MRGVLVLVPVTIAAIGTQAAAETTVSPKQFTATPPPLYATGVGETGGYPYRDQSLIIFRTYDKGSTTLHLRNVGTRPVRVTITFDCPRAPQCPQETSIVVPAVALQTDASQERTYRTVARGIYPFHWQLRLAENVAAQTQNLVARVAVSSHGETNAFVPVGDARVKFFVQRDGHSTGIYVRNVGRQRVHIQLRPHCAEAGLCPVLTDAIVPPVADEHDGRNDYIYTAQTLDKNFSFDWSVWIIDEPAAR